MTITRISPAEAGVAVGDFFVSSWGYDQTNIDFYKVVGLTAKGIKVQQWASRGGGGTEGPQVAVAPGDQPAQQGRWVTNDETGEVERVVADAPVEQKFLTMYGEVPWFTVNSYAAARKWDGRPEYRTGSGWGH